MRAGGNAGGAGGRARGVRFVSPAGASCGRGLSRRLLLPQHRRHRGAVARDSGCARVAILDIDYHHGNGTQDIFWDRGDVFYASIHADPATDYPFYWGHADEIGEGEGRGTTLNLPLPQGAGLEPFRRAQGVALEAITRFVPDLLIVSLGVDTWEGDPISHFKLTTADYAVLARDIAGCGWPTVVAMEGGYAVDALGANVASFLGGF
jgi:acetoin utilization deacetylase AcuC-like enzyme